MSYFDDVRGAPGRPGFYTLTGARIGPTPTQGGLLLAAGSTSGGCTELISKSYQRPARDGTPPSDPALTIDQDGEVITALPPFRIPGWVDQIARERSRASAREGEKRTNGVLDWVEMRAWDIYQDRRGELPATSIEEPTDGDPNQDEGVCILAGEPADVFAAVASVSSIRAVGRGDYAQTTSNLLKVSGTPVGWRVLPNVEFNVVNERLRTNVPTQDEVYPDESELNQIRHATNRVFNYVASHEARHAWQDGLWVRTPGPPLGDPQYLPATVSVLNEIGTAPDNNDDLGLGPDCLPEAAFLIDGRNVGIRLNAEGVNIGSAGEIIDSPDNREYPQTFSDGVVQACQGSGLATHVIQRDAVRFGRALDWRRTTCRP